MSSNRHWTTLDDLNRTPQAEKLRGEEFRAKPQEYFDALPQGGLRVGRRDFLKWSTGALALATTACVRKPTENLVPYVQQPPEILPGVANYYASTCRECSAGCGILVKTREGRPIKIEGNPQHPINKGTVCARGQASLLNLYDPDRLRTPVKMTPRNRGLDGLVAGGKQSVYDLWIPTNVWRRRTEMVVQNDPHPILAKSQTLTWDYADHTIAGMLNSAGNRGVLLTSTIHGPARTQLLADFLSVYPFRHIVYDSINPDTLTGAQQAGYGTPVVPRYLFDRAEMVVTFGGDPLGSGISRQEYSVGFGKQRKLREGQMSRVVAFEPAMSLTGMSADSRYLVPASQLLTVALGLANQLVLVNKQTHFAGDGSVARALESFTPAAVEKQTGLPAGALAKLAEALWAQRGKSIILAGGLAGATGDQDMLEIAVTFLNAALENDGSTIDGTGSTSQQAQGSNAAMLQLCNDMKQGKVQTLVIYDTNPAYTLPAAAGFVEALARVPNVVVVSARLDETALLADLVLPSLHGTEAWGDAEPQKGLYSLVQPTIEPLFGGRSFEDSLIHLAFLNPAGARFKAKPPAPAPVPPPAPTVPAPAGQAAAGTPAAGSATATTATAAPATAQAGAKTAAPAGASNAAAAPPPPAPPPPSGPMTFHDYLKDHWRDQIYARNNLAADFDDFWIGMLQSGVFDPNPRRAEPGSARSFRSAALAPAAMKPAASASGPNDLELVLTVSPMVGDGAHNNNAFMMEIPDQVSRVCWDNFVAIAPSTAKTLGLLPQEGGDELNDKGWLVSFSANGQNITAPVYVQPGVHPGVAAISVGWGRQSVGQVGTDVGVNVYPVPAIAGNSIVYSGSRIQLNKAGSGYLLASPQGNNYLEFKDPITEETGRGDDVIRETTLVQIQTDPRAGNPEQEPPANLWNASGASNHSYPGIHWGMTIDLNACIGCNACVAACYAENNVPFVGKDQVWRGRDMAWIRIDRYFSNESDNPDVTHQPMLCQQCENAGCESVCPVIATITDNEGLNVQVYNRCVGTRFCSNNCIYKVRRFNFYQYSNVRATPLELALNPEVTVRTKGIMEKCTFCTQRIHEGHYRAKELGLPVRDGDVKTACQQTCPTQAIYFGDMNDPESRMMQARTERGYRVLEPMNFKPSITYLTRVRNREEAVAAKEGA